MELAAQCALFTGAGVAERRIARRDGVQVGFRKLDVSPAVCILLLICSKQCFCSGTSALGLIANWSNKAPSVMNAC